MARARCASLDLGGSMENTPMLETLEEHPPQTPTSALIYSNVGELRAHLVPTKATRGDGARRTPPQLGHDPLPPPLPQKQLQRAESLPEQGTWQPYQRDPWPQHKDGAPKKPLTKSQSLVETQGAALKPSLEDLTFGMGDAVLGSILQGLEDRAGLCEAMVLKPGCCTTQMQSSLGAHCSIQRIISCFTDRLPGELVLPGHPGEQGLSPGCPAIPRVLQVLLSPDVPYQTLAEFMESSRALHRSSPGHYERLVCLLLLQLCAGLEHLRVQNAGQGDICPENLLLVECPCPPGSQQDKEESVGLSLPRLLISNIFKVKDKTRPCSTSQEWDWTKGSAALPTPMADELNVGMLIYKILHVDISLENALDLRSNQLPAIPSLSIYSTGLKHLATLLLHRDPRKRVSIKEARHILQVLLWGPRQELFAKSRKTLALLQSWLEMKRALLLLKLAEKAAGGSPGLEEWLCCQYFVEATEHMLYQVTQTLYVP
ncbi:UNVERIFIED_CONTAM: hypothetical protein H355_010559 [Colinus virginianus]|nr:hypothetical protein H355_010559 [Colinus virginianus]